MGLAGYTHPKIKLPPEMGFLYFQVSAGMPPWALRLCGAHFPWPGNQANACRVRSAAARLLPAASQLHALTCRWASVPARRWSGRRPSGPSPGRHSWAGQLHARLQQDGRA